MLRLALLLTLLAGSVQAAELTNADLRKIEAVNQAWNAKPIRVTGPVGPCAIYAVNKARQLQEAGYPVALAIVHVRGRPANETHIVAEVMGERNGKPVALVLDSLWSWTQERSDLEAFGYVWLVEWKQ